MCGRYSLGKTDRIDWGSFGVAPILHLVGRWNIAPGSKVLAIRDGASGREPAMLRWGLIPGWSSDPRIGSGFVNARAETAFLKPVFRDAFASRRCLLPADGFYEWEVVPGQKKKQPWRVEPRDGTVLALGALWESWRDPSGETTETCTILTVPVSASLAHIHDRMPVVVAPADFQRWLDPTSTMSEASGLCRPAPDALLDAWRISPAINSSTTDGPDLALPAVP